MYRREKGAVADHSADDVFGTHHNHHRAGSPPWMCYSTAVGRRFPHVDWEILSELGTDHLEIRGFSGFSHVRCPKATPPACICGRYSCHLDSVIVAADGACPGNGYATQSACGVYFGDVSDAQSYNLCWLVPYDPSHPHTNQRAELHAALGALKAVKVFAGPNQCETPCTANHIVIKSDSAYLVDSITNYIGKWISNGWLNSSKRPVANRDLWEDILTKISDLEDLGAHVDFWHVPRERNTEADRLANLALSGNGIPAYSPSLGHNVLRFP